MTLGNSSTAVVLFAHGSSVEEANRGVHALAQRVQELGPFHHVRAAFLEPFRPGLGSAVDEAVKAGFSRIIVIPYFLTMGLHMRRDLPKLLAAQKGKHPQIEIVAGEPLEEHPLMASIIVGRIREVLEEAKVAR